MKDRWDIISDLINTNDYKIIAEVGVSRGINASNILKKCPNIHKMYLIDKSYAVLDKGLFAENWSKIKLVPVVLDAEVDLFFLKEIDLVFIDADHTYEQIKKDIQLWKTKIRKNGIISGHDYGDIPGCRGVKKAVTELLGEVNLEKDVLENGEIYIWWKYI